MDHLMRQMAPVSEAGWEEIESEATRTLTHFLAARRLVDYRADGSWATSARSLGRVTQVSTGDPALEVANRLNQPLTEVRVAFSVARTELDALDRGATDVDTQPIIDAARTAALAEDSAVFAGNEAAGIAGIESQTPHDVITIDPSFDDFQHMVARAVDLLQDFGVDGPFGIAMGPRCWTGVMESSERGGYPLVKHLRLLLEGPVVWAPSVEGAIVVSQRGGDFELSGGQDWSIGYRGHDANSVHLYLEESFSFVINSPEAAVALGFPA